MLEAIGAVVVDKELDAPTNVDVVVDGDFTPEVLATTHFNLPETF
jgi:hypothetical protein